MFKGGIPISYTKRDFFKSKFEEKQVFFTASVRLHSCNWFYTEKRSPVPYTFTPLDIVCEVLGS